MSTLIYTAQFTHAKYGVTGLTTTVNVDRITLSSGTRTVLTTGAAATEARNGIYYYRLTSADPILYEYIVVFSGTGSSVDQHEILGTLQPDPAARITDNLLAAAVPAAYTSGSVGVEGSP